MGECGMCTMDGETLPPCEDVSALPEPGWRDVVGGLVADVELAARTSIPDAALRADYVAKARAAAAEIIAQVERGALTPRQAAERANALRNAAMESMRAESSSLGRSIARWLKEEGATLSQLEERYAQRLFGRSFEALDEAARARVWLRITERAGVTNPKVNFAMRWAPRAGRGFLVAGVAVAVYQVATAEDPGWEARRQGGALGGGVGLGIVATTMTGLVCGPGAPVCSGILVFVGGVIGALAGEAFLTNLWK